MTARPELDGEEEAGGVIELSAEDSRKLLDIRAYELLGMTGEEFLRRWRDGEFKGQDERSEVWDVAMLVGGTHPG